MSFYAAKYRGGVRNKLGAKRTEYNGKSYQSRKEAQYAADLDKCRNAVDPAQRVENVETQVPFRIVVNGIFICKYLLDFRVTYADGHIEHVDVKGWKGGDSYERFKLKKKLVEATYEGVTIKEV